MKVTFATTWESRCGIAAYSRSLIAELEKRVEIEVVSLDPGAFQSPARLAARLNQGDLAHIQHQYPFFGGMALHRNWLTGVLRRLAVPLVVTVHELDLGDSDSWPIRMYKRWFNRYLFCRAEIDRILVHTSEYRGKLRDLGIEPEDIRVVPMGVPKLPQPAVSSDEAKVQLGLAGRKIVTIFGFVVRRKGYEIALEALRHLPDDTVLLIAGGAHPGDRTGFFDELKDRIASEGLSRRAVVTDYLPEHRVPVVMAAADVVAAPSIEISSSWSLMHAMAYGKPIVASDLPATREINARLPCLSLFKVADPLDLAEKVRELLEDERKLEAAAAAVRSYAQEWSVALAAAETLAIYEELCETPGA